jgi:hypothetical protein
MHDPILGDLGENETLVTFWKPYEAALFDLIDRQTQPSLFAGSADKKQTKKAREETN